MDHCVIRRDFRRRHFRPNQEEVEAGARQQLVDGELQFLPALPKAWDHGEVTGLRARGGLEVDVKWNDGLPGTATLRPTVDGVHVLRPPTGSRIRQVRDGRQLIPLQPGAGSSASLPVKAGHVYSIQFERTGG